MAFRAGANAASGYTPLGDRTTKASKPETESSVPLGNLRYRTEQAKRDTRAVAGEPELLGNGPRSAPDRTTSGPGFFL